jgi:molybdate transport system ATP-binding protein
MTSDGRLCVQVRGQRAAQHARFAFDVSLDFGPGLNVLFGPSGSGKTTILSTIAGLLRPDAGRITLAGQTLFDDRARVDLPPNERGIALVFQSLALFPHLDALRNVAYGVPRSVRKSARLERAESWLARMRVEHLMTRYPGSFSGGEAQRVALARALASEPRALLLDEPFSALDQHLASELGAELTKYVEATQMPVVLVTHDRHLARRLGRSVTLLRAGRVEQIGLAREVLSDRD